MSSASDRKLIKEALSGREEAYTLLMQAYYGNLLNYTQKLVDKNEAEDLTLEIFTKAFQNLQTYNPQFAFWTWLKNIARNHCLDFQKQQRKKTFIFTDLPSCTEETSLHEAEYLGKYLPQLPPLYQEIFSLRYEDQLSYKLIAEKMNLPMGTVKNRLFRGKIILRKLKKQ